MRTYEEIAVIMRDVDDELFDALSIDCFNSFHDKRALKRFLTDLAFIGITEDEFWMWNAN